jgi:hypothetical protein
VGYRLVLDENVDRERGDRLTALGHDLERVTDVDELGAGAPDEALARYSADSEQALLTHDEDVVTNDAQRASSEPRRISRRPAPRRWNTTCSWFDKRFRRRRGY